MFLGQAESFARGIDKLCAGFAVRFERPRDFRNSFADQSVRDNELWFAVVVFLRVIQRIEKCLHVLAVDFLNVEAISFETRGRVFALRRFRRRIERDRVRIVNQNQIIQAEMSGERARFGRHAFLQTAIAGQTDDVLIENLVLVGVEARRRHLGCDRNSNRIAHALAQRAGGAFHAGRFEKLGMSRRFGMQLPETFDLRHRQIVAAQIQPGVKEHAAVTGGENEVIAPDPTRFVRIMFQGVAVKHRAHFRAAQRQAEVAGLRGLHGVHAKAARFIRRAGKDFEIQTHKNN